MPERVCEDLPGEGRRAHLGGPPTRASKVTARTQGNCRKRIIVLRQDAKLRLRQAIPERADKKSREHLNAAHGGVIIRNPDMNFGRGGQRSKRMRVSDSNERSNSIFRHS